MRFQHQSRRGFTLVELLVAAALTMLIMAILASAFQTAMDSMSHLRAAAEMQDRLRSASERLRTDLMAPHFEDEAIGRGQLSNLRFDLGNSLPAGGYFNIIQATPSMLENRLGVLTPNDFSSYAPGTIRNPVTNVDIPNHTLSFTAKLSGKNAQNLFTAPRPAGTLDQTNDNLVNSPLTTYASKWAVVSWFLAPSDLTTGPNPKTMYTLHRRVKLLAEIPDCFIAPAFIAEAGNYYVIDNRPQIQRLISTSPTIQYAPVEVNTNYGRVLTVKDDAVRGPAPVLVGTNLYVNGAPAPVIPPLNVRTMTPGVTTTASVIAVLTDTAIPDIFTPAGNGSDIVVSNVVSFEVKADYTQVIRDNAVSSAISQVLPSQTNPTGSPLVPANPQNPLTGIGYPTIFPRPAVGSQPLLVLPGTGDPNLRSYFNPFSNPDFPFDDLPQNQKLPLPAQRQQLYLQSIYDPLKMPTVTAANLPLLNAVFDTGSPAGYRVKALQVKIRIYDPKTMGTRQVTVIQEM